MTETSAELTRKLSVAVEQMPAFPKSVQRILELSRDINSRPKDLVMVIEKDPVMTMKLLRILNSAYYSFPKQITSVNQSVVFLGLNTIKNMALSFAAMGVLPQTNAADFDIQRYLMHSLTTASIARTLCQKFGADIDPTDCYIAGLLHDFGKVVFAQFMPTEFKEALTLSAEEEISLHDAEKLVIGADHSLVGAMLVEKWQFPVSLTDTIRHHHDQLSPANTLQCCLFVADQISKELYLSTRSELQLEELPTVLITRFGSMASIVANLGDLSKVVAEAHSFTRGTEA